MYVVRKQTIRSHPAARRVSAALAPSPASEMNPASATSQSSARIRADTCPADRCSCGRRSGNCGQYAPRPPATKPTLVRLPLVLVSPPVA